MKQYRYLLWFIVLAVLWLGTALAVREIKRSRWDGTSHFAWVEQEGEAVKVKLVLPEQKREVIFNIPGGTLVKAGFGFGEYRLNKIYELGELEKKGGKLLTRAVQNLLGVGVSGWRTEGKTNLSRWDRFRLGWFEQVTAGRHRTEVNWLAEGEEAIRNQVFDETLSAEGLSAAVANATGVEGTAAAVSRLINNLGVNVVRLGNQEPAADSTILVKDKGLLTTKTVSALAKLLDIHLIRVNDTNSMWSDIVVVIGQDYTSL